MQQSRLSADRPALVCAVCNQKGGVGKTTSTCHLARAASLQGLAVLVVDLDPQGNTTSVLSTDPQQREMIGVAETLTANAEYGLADVIGPTVWDGVSLAPTPSTESLATGESNVAAMRFGREHRLADVMLKVVGDYDLILIDTMPALGVLLVNALVAADLALVVTQPEQWSADGLAELHHTIDGVRRYHNPRLRPVGPLINGKRHSAHHDRIVHDEIVPFYGNQAWVAEDEIIPLWAPITDYLLAGQGLDQAKEVRVRVLAEVYARFVRRLLDLGDRR